MYLLPPTTPTPPKLTAERVERGPIVRPEYPTTSMAVNDIMGYPLVKMTAALCVQSWSLKASQGLLGEETTGIMRQVDPMYSRLISSQLLLAKPQLDGSLPTMPRFSYVSLEIRKWKPIKR